MLGERERLASAEAKAYVEVNRAGQRVKDAEAALQWARAAHMKADAALIAFDTKASLSDPHKEGE